MFRYTMCFAIYNMFYHVQYVLLCTICHTMCNIHAYIFCTCVSTRTALEKIKREADEVDRSVMLIENSITLSAFAGAHTCRQSAQRVG